MSLTVNANTHRIVATRGDDHKIRFTVKNASGVAYNVSANTFKFTVKTSLDDAIADAKFQKTSPAGTGIDLTSAATGIVDVNLVPADTSALAGLYFYDLEMTEGGLVYTVRQGVFEVEKDVSTPGAAPASPSVVVPFPAGLLLSALYFQDSVVTTDFYKLTIASGILTQAGSNTTVPF